MTIRTTAERLDAAVDGLLTGGPTPVDPELRPLVDTASRLHAALHPLPAGQRFEARLAARLLRPAALSRLAVAVGRRVGRGLRHPLRWLAVLGGVGSAALGVLLLSSRRNGHR